MPTSGPFETNIHAKALEDFMAFFRPSPVGAAPEDGPGATRCRVAVGVFTALDQLMPVLDELRPLPPHVKLCLVAARSALGRALADKYAAGSSSLFGMVLIDPDAHDSEDSAEAAPGTKSDCIFLAQLGDSFPPRLAGDLKQKLADGSCLLFVRIEEPEYEAFACQTLIRHATGLVQVHDVTLRSGTTYHPG